MVLVCFRDMKKDPNMIRGALVTLVLGLPFLFFVVNAALIMGTGGVGEATAYFGFMLSVIPAILLGSAIRWAFYGKKNPYTRD